MAEEARGAILTNYVLNMTTFFEVQVPHKATNIMENFKNEALAPEALLCIKGGNGGAQNPPLPPFPSPTDIIVVDQVVTIVAP